MICFDRISIRANNKNMNMMNTHNFSLTCVILSVFGWHASNISILLIWIQKNNIEKNERTFFFGFAAQKVHHFVYDQLGQSQELKKFRSSINSDE